MSCIIRYVNISVSIVIVANSLARLTGISLLNEDSDRSAKTDKSAQGSVLFAITMFFVSNGK